MVCIPGKAHVLVCDGARALLLRNQGDGRYPNLRKVWISEREALRASELGRDRLTRVYQSIDGRRSEVHQADLHQRGEDDLAHEAAAAIEELRQSGNMRVLIVVAPARTLGILRRIISAQTQDLILKEFAKDLAGMPIYEIEQHLMQL